MSSKPPSSGRLRQAIDASLNAVQAKPENAKDREEQAALASDHAKAALDGLREDNRNKKANRRLRWRYARWVFCYLVIYSIFSAILILLHGFNIFGFNLPEVVLGALVGSTAVAAIGLVASVVSGLFKSA